jgi:hypothetical protein
MRRLALYVGLIVYGVGIFLVCDLVFSSLFYRQGEGKVRVAHAVYHHGLAPSVDGYSRWGELPYRIKTNSLGFKDAAVRDVPLQTDVRRVVLIGDSFTEAVGIPFEESFAGLLYQAGHAREQRIEFLNAGVGSYSPTLYYKKIKHLIDSGLQVDEVIVFPDISDVYDEATAYFCVDDDPGYRRHCSNISSITPALRDFLNSRFVLTTRLHRFAKLHIRSLLGARKKALLDLASRDEWGVRGGWTLPQYSAGNAYAPLGVDGGIQRALKNMRALADLLQQRNIALSVVVYPWPSLVDREMRESRYGALWREFCQGRCKAFIDLVPSFIDMKKANADWYERLFIPGDVHFSAGGHKLVFRELSKHLLGTVKSLQHEGSGRG